MIWIFSRTGEYHRNFAISLKFWCNFGEISVSFVFTRFITLSTRRRMINEDFVIETDKNGQILALDFGSLETLRFLFCFGKTWSIGLFMFDPVNNYGHGERLASSFRQELN